MQSHGLGPWNWAKQAPLRLRVLVILEGAVNFSTQMAYQCKSLRTATCPRSDSLYEPYHILHLHQV